jgi:hypothetical protein
MLYNNLQNGPLLKTTKMALGSGKVGEYPKKPFGKNKL